MFGLLNLNKPKDITSRKVVDRAQRLVKPAKAGHAGTLDPLATGVLIVCLGPATRLIPFVQNQRKIYRANFQMGCQSDTDDITGNVIFNSAAEVSQNELEAALPQFLGEIEQVPPQFSAVHVQGKRAYELARAGQTVQIAPKIVHVYRIDLLSFAWPNLELEIECGSGTYIRSIGRDLGEILGCGAVMTDLVRTRIGPFCITKALPLKELDQDRLQSSLISPVKAVQHLPTYRATSAECLRIKRGQRIPSQNLLDVSKNERIAVLTESQELAALAEWDAATRELRPRQVFLK